MSAQVTKKLLRIIVYGILGFFLLLISAFLVLQLPSVQSYLLKHYLQNLTEKTGFNLGIRRAHFMWFDRLQLQGVTIDDPQNNRMIAAGELLINFKLSNLYQKKGVNIDGVKLDSGTVYLTPLDTSGTLNINTFIERIQDLTGPSSSTGSKTNIGEAVLSNCTFTYFRPDRDSSVSEFDPNHFKVLINEAQVQNFTTVRDTVAFRVQTLEAQDVKTGLTIKQLSTFFRISQRAMEFSGVDLHVGNSLVRDTVIFEYPDQQALSSFIDSVSIKANLKNSVIDPADLALFAPRAAQIGKPVTVSGRFSGKVNRFRIARMNLALGATTLKGALEMDGLPDFYETFIVLDLTNAHVDFADFPFLLKDESANRITPLGPLSLSGQFIGYPTDFVANGNFNSRLGQIVSDINFKVDEADFNNSSYSGSLKLVDFQLGKYVNDTTSFQRVTLNGKLAGKGLTVNTANFNLDGTVQSIGLLGYAYSNITTNARFASGFFKGTLNIDDPNLQFSGEGSVDFRNQADEINFVADIDTVNLQPLGFLKEQTSLKAKIDVNLKGLTLEKLTGRGDIRNLRLNYLGKNLELDTLRLLSEKNGDQRSLELNTTLLNASITGNFSFDNLFSDIQTFGKEFYLNLQNDQEKVAAYYAEKNETPSDYQTTFHFNFKNVDPIVDLLGYDVSIGYNTRIDGHFTSGYTTIINAYTTIDTLRIGEQQLFDSEVEITASKISDSSNVLAMAYLYSPVQHLAEALNTANLTTEAIWNNNLIDFTLNADQQGELNKLRMSGNVEFQDSTLIRFKNSSIELLGHSWQLDPRNTIKQKGREWTIQDLRFTYEDQTVVLNGKLSEDPSKKLKLDITNFDLATLNVLLVDELKGTLNAEVDVRNYRKNISLENQIDIKDLYLNNFKVGNITGNNIWDVQRRQFAIDFFIDRNNLRIVNLTGYYDPANKTSPLNLKATFADAELRIFETLLDNIFSQINGKINGAYSITGTLQEPEINGSAQVTEAQLMVDYLKTLYHFSGTVRMTPTSINLQNMALQDALGNHATVNGEITHKNFGAMHINLDASFSNFQLLNTTLRDNDLFFGQGYGSGTANIQGPISNLVITATATTEKNTRIFIPVSGNDSFQSPDYINFVSFSDSTFRQRLQSTPAQRPELSGIVLNLDLNVTTDAYCEIIFDLRTGDIIRGRGNGNLRLQIDTKGEFNMFGPIEFTEGGYNFTIPYEDITLVNKDFVIQRGSRITWYGDPYGAELDVTGSYNQLASLAPIITDQTLASAPQLRRKYPVQVLLKLQGPMFSPDISFDITAANCRCCFRRGQQSASTP